MKEIIYLEIIQGKEWKLPDDIPFNWAMAPFPNNTSINVPKVSARNSLTNWCWTFLSFISSALYSSVFYEMFRLPTVSTWYGIVSRCALTPMLSKARFKSWKLKKNCILVFLSRNLHYQIILHTNFISKFRWKEEIAPISNLQLILLGCNSCCCSRLYKYLSRDC